MRSYFEALEDQILAPYAVKSRLSRGRLHAEPPSPTRTCFQRDRDRIVHSKAFRRLKQKTQVFIATQSDHFRSRLTHSLEVSQISRHLARLLRLNEDLSESVALAHDLGHTPFGHSGERILNKLMEQEGGFEHNQQSLRVVDLLETKYPQFPGLNLSFETRAGLMKHKTPYDSPSDEMTFVSLEAQVVNLSDQVAYNNHDLDDGISSGILNESELAEHVTLWKEAKAKIKTLYTNLTVKESNHLMNSYLISSQIENIFNTTQSLIQSESIETFSDLQSTTTALVDFSPEMNEKNQELRKHLFTKFYMHHEVYRMNKRGQQIIEGLFKAFMEDRKLLPQKYQQAISAQKESRARIVADYIAGMTDVYAEKEYRAIFM